MENMHREESTPLFNEMAQGLELDEVLLAGSAIRVIAKKEKITAYDVVEIVYAEFEAGCPMMTTLANWIAGKSYWTKANDEDTGAIQ